MRRFIISLSIAILASAHAFAQSAPQNPPMRPGLIPTTGQWIQWFQQKQDYPLTVLQAAQFPSLTGDVTTTAGSLATTIGAGVVTAPKMAAGAAAANFGATNCNAIGASACGANGILTYTTVQNYGAAGHVGGNAAEIQSSSDQSSAFFGFVKTRSTVKGGGPGTAVQPGDGLGEVDANADDGTNFVSAATDNWSVDAAVSTGVMPTNRQIWLGNASGTHTLAALWDSYGNQYLRNGYLGIGSYYGYNPPAVYSSGIAPPYPISIVESAAGTYFGAFESGTTGGGAQIEVSNGFTSTTPVYGFWYNAGSGLGNPATNVVSVINNSSESWRMDANKHQSFTSGTRPTVSACGTGAIIDSYATDNSGTIAAGTGTVTSCTLTFRVAYTTYNHCRVTPTNLTLAGAAYTYTLSAITITATSLTSQIFGYSCDGQ